MILLSIAIEPSLVADNDEREPRKSPIGVRATPMMQTSVPNLLTYLSKPIMKQKNLTGDQNLRLPTKV